MANQDLLEDAEKRATRRLRAVGCYVTWIWILGIGVYFVGLGANKGGWSHPTFDLNYWDENVGFLADWTTLIVTTGSLFAILRWPKKFFETIVDLFSRPLSELLGYVLDSFASRSIDKKSPEVPPGSGGESKAAASSPPQAQEPLLVSPAARGAASPPKSQRGSFWGWVRWIAFVLAMVMFIGWCAVNQRPSRQEIPMGDEEPQSIGQGGGAERFYVIREGDGRGAVEAITRSIGDPLVRARCINALESDPMNRPPHDRRQRPGHKVKVPAVCPLP